MSTSRPLIAVVGDASFAPGSQKDRMAEEMGRILIDHSYRLLTGGMGGVMEAASRGARSSQKYRSGDTIAVLPGHDPSEANAFIDVAIPSGLDHARNLVVAHADAVIAIGGGAGTLSEICFAWIYKRLVVALRVDGWSGKIADQRIDHRIRYPEIPDDCVFGASTAAEAVDILNTRLHEFCGQHHGVARRR